MKNIEAIIIILELKGSEQMGWRYRDERGAGCLTTLIVALVVGTFVAYFAAYVFLIILGIALVISGIIGTVVAVYNYASAFINSIKSHRYAYSPNKASNFVYWWYKVNFETVKIVWKSNILGIKTLGSKIGFYKVLSFRKWICLYTTLSIAAFGTVVSVAAIFMQVIIVIAILCIFFGLLVLICAISTIIGLGIVISKSITNYFLSVSESFRKYSYSVSQYIVKYSYKEFVKIVKSYFEKLDIEVKNVKTEYFTLPFKSVRKWIDLGVLIMLYPIGIIILFPIFIIHLIVNSFLFAIFGLISFLKKDSFAKRR